MVVEAIVAAGELSTGTSTTSWRGHSAKQLVGIIAASSVSLIPTAIGAMLSTVGPKSMMETSPRHIVKHVEGATE